MQHIIISLSLILVLVFTDLVPLFKRKEKLALWFAVPSYAFALVLGILVGLDVNVISPNQIVITLIQHLFKMK